MDYEKKYKEALELAKDYFKANQKLGESEENDMLSDIFPELAESEDENCLSTIIAVFSKCAGKSVSKDEWMRCNDFLNSLKERMKSQQVKNAWNEEDENVLVDVEEAIINYWHGQSQEDLLDWLKSLKDRYTWKPSDEQMKVLVWCRPLFYDPKSKAVLESLINDLKKLKGE